MELMATANALGSETYRYLEPYTMVGFIFLAISLPSAFGLRRLEAWVKIKSGIEK
jgi:polar amino acid transport system permease protein